MKTILAWSVVAFLIYGIPPTFSAENELSPEKIQLKDQMSGLMRAFRDLESPLGRKPPDYEAIAKLLDEMTERAKTVQALKNTGHPGKDWKRLFQDLDEFKKNTRAKSASGMEDSMNRLAENCFRCHLSHDEPKSEPKKSP